MKLVHGHALPENTRYRDSGCEYSPKCVECPLPTCRYDQPEKLRRIERAELHDQVFDLVKSGVPPVEIQRQFRISSRTVHRIRQRGGAAPTDRGKQLELDDVQGKSPLDIGSPIKQRAPLPVMRENTRGRA